MEDRDKERDGGRYRDRNRQEHLKVRYKCQWGKRKKEKTNKGIKEKREEALRV